MGLATIGTDTAILLLIPNLRILGVWGILMGIFFLSWAMFYLRYARGLAQRKTWAVRGLKEKPKPYWFAKERNVTRVIFLGLLLSFFAFLICEIIT